MASPISANRAELLAIATSVANEKLIDKAPERVIQGAVKGMLPRNPLGRAMFKKLKVYAGDEHPHAAQQPQALNI